MKNKGFTLAELLAVITLLALILVFVLPKILNVYNNKKDEVKESKARVIYSAADTYLKENIDDYPMTTGYEYCLDIDDLDKENLIPIDVTDITNETAGLKVKIGINGKKTYNLVNRCSSKVHSLGDLVYFDPVNLNGCSSSTFNLDNIKNGTSTCYKWRVITVGDTDKKKEVTIQMDHNLIESIWAPEHKVTAGPITALSNLETATTNWNIPLLNYEYDSTSIGKTNNYGTLTCISGTCTITGNSTPLTSNLKARIITKEELYAIEDATNWTTANAAWMMENTNSVNYGTANLYGEDNGGYWTLTTVRETSNLAAEITHSSFAANMDVSYAQGLRPVITIPKSWIK